MIDEKLYSTRRAFDCAGGPDEVYLTAKGRERTAKVAAGLEPGPAGALEELHALGGEAHTVQSIGARVLLTPFGKRHSGRGHLETLSYRGLAERFRGGYRLTVAGREALCRIFEERDSLLERIRAEAEATPDP